VLYKNKITGPFMQCSCTFLIGCGDQNNTYVIRGAPLHRTLLPPFCQVAAAASAAGARIVFQQGKFGEPGLGVILMDMDGLLFTIVHCLLSLSFFLSSNFSDWTPQARLYLS